MALPATRDEAETALDMIEGALTELQVLRAGESVSSEDAALGLTKLRRMLRTWAVDGVRLWLTDEDVLTLAADTGSYTLDPRYLEIRSAFRRDASGNDTPIRVYTREEYNRLPDKDASGAPFVVFVDRERAQATAYVYPVPSASGSFVHLSGKRQILDVVSLSENVEFPPEWSEAIVYNLAVRLAGSFNITPADDLIALAGQTYAILQGNDRQGSVFMRPGRH